VVNVRGYERAWGAARGAGVGAGGPAATVVAAGAALDAVGDAALGAALSLMTSYSERSCENEPEGKTAGGAGVPIGPSSAAAGVLRPAAQSATARHRRMRAIDFFMELRLAGIAWRKNRHSGGFSYPVFAVTQDPTLPLCIVVLSVRLTVDWVLPGADINR
jgi:hypothetical protein